MALAISGTHGYVIGEIGATGIADAAGDVGRGLTPAIFELSKTLPSSYRIVTGGTVEESQKSQASVLAVVSVMLLIMLTVLMFQLQSFQRLVSFNATLMKELRMIALLRQVADPGSGEGARWAGMRTHRIMTEMMTELGYTSKMNAERAFLKMLRDEGRRATSAFPDAHADDLGRSSTTDLDALLAEC
jgi:hypothetical protein